MINLVALETISKGQALSARQQLAGARSSEISEANKVVLSTPYGLVNVRRVGLRVLVEGNGVPPGSVDAPDPLSIRVARRGMRGQVGSQEFTMTRPHFGWRLKHRSVVLEAGLIRWQSIMYSYRSFEIRSCDVGQLIIATSIRRHTRVSALLSAEELVLALLFERCGIIQGSSLVNYLTF